MATILCVDDTPADLELAREALEEAGHEVLTAEHVPAALQVLEEHEPDLILSDYRLPKVSGLEFLNILLRKGLGIPLIMSTAYATVEDAVSSLKAGAIDYVTKPVRPEELRFAVAQALELTSLRRENAQLRGEISQLRVRREILGESAALRKVMETVQTVAPTRATVLIQGESGTGKELLARALHDLSERGGGPFVALNCAAIPETLVESSLFGHEKGAFTGATKRVPGAFERAHGGTLLLDEISEMQIELQAKLLRALQEQEFERVGGTSPIRVDTRVVATTNRDLAGEVRAGRFREDLYFRLAVVPIKVPALRERSGDVLLLAQQFARRAADQNGKELTGFSPEAVQLLNAHTWPGNVRELQHAVERAVILSRDPTLRPSDFDLTGAELRSVLPDREPASAAAPAAAPEGTVMLHSLDVREAEEALIEEALRRTRGNRTRASELLGINPRTLRNKLNRPDD
ncbi:MAG: sigma-54 dependent transcriptional regulator [Gemmatimonadota bacterium]